MIAALARGARIFDDPQYEAAACAAADFILVKMRDSAGRLLHRFRDGDAAIDAFLDDYAFLIWGLLDLYETNFAVKYLQAAIELNNYLLKHFRDQLSGGFNFSSDKHEQLLFPRKTIIDGAIPSGNSVAALNLIRLSKMTGNNDLEEMFTKIGRAFSGTVKNMPSAVPLFLTALDMAIGPSLEVVITGPVSNENTKAMIRAAQMSSNPNKVILFIPESDEKKEIIKLAPFTRDIKCIDGKATAYVCSANSCRKPTTDIAEMEQFLGSRQTDQS
jgi:hypothetical protein